MRTLAGLGILTERDAQRFALTPLGRGAQDRRARLGAGDADRVLRPGVLAQLGGDPLFAETGKTGFEKAWGMPVFDYLAQHPEEASYFSEAMVGFHGAEPPAVAAAYDFSGFKTVVDVGGATGNMLAAILSRHAGPRGVLFDRPHVVRDAPALLKARGVEERVTIEAGRFLREGARRGRRLPVVAHHPRLERGSVPHHPGPLPQGHQAGWPPADRRDRPARPATRRIRARCRTW